MQEFVRSKVKEYSMKVFEFKHAFKFMHTYNENTCKSLLHKSENTGMTQFVVYFYL